MKLLGIEQFITKDYELLDLSFSEVPFSRICFVPSNFNCVFKNIVLKQQNTFKSIQRVLGYSSVMMISFVVIVPYEKFILQSSWRMV